MESTKELNTKQNMKTIDIVYVAIGAALIAICSWISIPTAVPFTLQTFAVFTILLMLGGQKGTLSILIYILIGAVGLPVFSGFKGGVGVLLGNTGGYILGFIIMGLIYSLAIRLFGRKMFVEIAALLVGLAACYAVGTAWFIYVYTRQSGAVGLITVLSWCVFPFIIPDLIKLTVAYVISKRTRKILMH